MKVNITFFLFFQIEFICNATSTTFIALQKNSLNTECPIICARSAVTAGYKRAMNIGHQLLLNNDKMYNDLEQTGCFIILV